MHTEPSDELERLSCVYGTLLHSSGDKIYGIRGCLAKYVLRLVVRIVGLCPLVFLNYTG